MHKLLKRALDEYGVEEDSIAVRSLKQDASDREYHRITWIDSEQKFLAVVYKSKKNPESSSDNSLTPDLAFLEVGKLFCDNGILTPEIIWWNSSRDVYFIEDFGDFHLGDLLPVKGSAEADVTKRYLEAISVADKISLIDESSHFVFSQRFTAGVFFNEMKEFEEFFLEDEVSERERSELLSNFQQISEYLFSLDMGLVHRDFHSWNIIIRPDGKIGVIDFQDALIGPKYYDVACLLHDRDTDTLLGEQVYKELLNSIFIRYNFSKIDVVNFLTVALQRDIKVVGRFMKLVKVMDRESYLKWVPGTCFRIGKILSFLQEESPAQLKKSFRQLNSFLCSQSQVIDKGCKGSFNLPFSS